MAARLRAAIYTRKSTEEGLDQAFNSLDAQREASEAYIASQKSEGWSLVRTRYDDGGWSGGNMDRPGLKALLADIEEGKVDIVVVYKVDRLSRSLADFARIVDLFDRHKVSFVSVTQAFNTTTSMGRLTLNVLLSFAQFEREVTGERIRDKIAASKAKGMWMGGTAPLGYDPKERTLTINETEANTVRHIFRRFLELGSLWLLQQELEREGYRSKRYTSKAGNVRGGVPLAIGPLRHLLRNRLYLGEIVHHGTIYPGLHPPIIDAGVFEAAQQLWKKRVRHRPRRPTRAPLAGLLVDALGRPMVASHARKRGKRYDYYLSSVPPSHPDAPRVRRRVSAPALEEIVITRLRVWSNRPAAGWPDLLPFVRRIELHPRAFVAQVAPPALEDWQTDGTEHCITGHDGLTITSPLAIHQRGARSARIAASMQAGRSPDRALIAGLRRAHAELRERGIDLTDPASADAARGVDDPYLRRLVMLAFLAPDIQRAILEGRQPAGLKLADLMSGVIPLGWADQREWLAGLASPVA